MQKASVAGTTMVQDFKLFDCRIIAGSRKIVYSFQSGNCFRLFSGNTSKNLPKNCDYGCKQTNKHMNGIANKWEGW